MTEKRVFWISLLKYFKPVRFFIIMLGIIISVSIVTIFIGIYYSNRNMIIQTLKGEAASYFDLILKAREWNALHSGVYILKKPGMESNPYLKKLGIEPDITAKDGRVLTLRNPALMTKEISALTLKEEGTTFRITSLRLINPENAPDPFERAAMVSFEQGAKEAWKIEARGDKMFFRLIKPLYIQQGCLNCHKDYKLGDIRGGISISIPFDEISRQLKESRTRVIFYSAFTLLLLLGTLITMSSSMVRKLDAMQERLREVSITDELTGARNRRFIMERLAEEFQMAKRTGSPMTAIMLDLDHFKKINDTYGHPFGDVVLKTVAQRIKARLRAYDVFGRYGGEEFLIISPRTPLEDGATLADRILDVIRAEKVGDGTNEITVSASIGVSVYSEADEGSEALLQRVDRALYRAKDEGRSRVVVD